MAQKKITELTEDAAPAATDYAVVVEDPTGTPATKRVTLSALASTGLGVYNVKDPAYGALGDGTTNDTTAVQAAIDAGSTGDSLYWPPGTYAVSGNLTNFHNRRHIGRGAVITRGSDSFTIEPDSSDTNKFYCDASSGADANDGLDSANAFLSIQSAVNAIRDTNQRGQWEIHLAAGTYNQNLGSNTYIVEFAREQFRTQKPIYIYGPTQGHPNVPTAIIDVGAHATSIGGVFVGKNCDVIITDVKVTGLAAGNAFSNTGGYLVLTNCHTDNCFRGVVSQHLAFTSVAGGDYDGNDISLSVGFLGLYNATHSISTADQASAAVFHNFDRGVQLGEGCQGHLDFCTIEDCNIVSGGSGSMGLYLTRGCGQVNTKQMQIYRNNMGVVVNNNGWFDNNIDYGIGGANVNTVNVRLEGDAPEQDFHTDNATFPSTTPRIVERTNSAAHTGTAVETELISSRVLADWGVNQGSYHRSTLKVYGVCTLTGNCTIRGGFYNGSSTTQTGTLILTSGVTNFEIQYDVYYVAAATQRTSMKIAANGGFMEVDYGSSSQDLTDVTDHNLRMSVELANTGDSITFENEVLETTLAG